MTEFSQKTLKVGDVVLIKHGNALCRDSNPSGKIRVRIKKILIVGDEGKFGLDFAADATMSGGHDFYYYNFSEILANCSSNRKTKGKRIGDFWAQ